jgi:hypothetical protein
MISLGTTGISGHDLSLKLSYTLDSSQNPIIIRSVTASAAERPRIIEQIQAVVRCSNNLTLNTPAKERRTAAEIKADLKALADPLRGPVELIDRVGAHRYALVLAPVDEREVESEGDAEPEDLLTLHMAIWTPTVSRLITQYLALEGATEPWTIPMDIPLNIGTNLAGKFFMVRNLSAKTAWPIIAITGPITGFIIANFTWDAGITMAFPAHTIAAGDTYTIDLLHTPQTITDSAGVDQTHHYFDMDGHIYGIPLIPGENQIYVIGTGIDERTTLSIAYLLS